MNIHEFGKENERVIMLIHPSIVKWDYYEYVIPLLENDYRLIIPALPGYDFDNDSDFTSVEQIAGDLVNWLIRYMKKYFPGTSFGRYPNLGHAGLVLLKPELFAKKIKSLE